MGGPPLVSIITPSYNQGRWLGDALQSVSKQSYPALEHIVVDGCSSDSTLEVLRSAPATVRWVSGPDRGQSHALNQGFAMSHGEIIGWLNSDDAYFGTDVVATVVQAFERYPDAIVVYGHAALMNAEGLILHAIWVPPFSRKLLRLHNFLIQPAAFVRRAAVAPLLVDESFEHAMDAELWLRLSERGRFVRIDRIVAIERHHSGRKVVARRDAVDADTHRLAISYRLERGTAATALRKGVKIAQRLVGVRLIPQVTGPRVCSSEVDSATALLVRQVARRRRSMPTS